MVKLYVKTLNFLPCSPGAETVTDETATEESVTEESVREETVTEESATMETATEESVTEESVTEESVTEETVTKPQDSRSYRSMRLPGRFSAEDEEDSDAGRQEGGHNSA
jgi:hypothetical protein